MTESTESGVLAAAENPLFHSLKFFVTGQVSEEIVNQLKHGGAERMNYFSDYVTHLICGDHPEETDLSEANDLYDVPAIKAKWVEICTKLNRLISPKPFLYRTQTLFGNFVFCPSKLGADLENVWAMVTYHGGQMQLNWNKNCTHLVTYHANTPKYTKLMALGSDSRIVIVTPDWIVECIKQDALVQPNIYHPRLVEWPKVTKQESTVAITGFEPEKIDQTEEKDSKTVVNESTQALLEQLKQRMPWNRPQTSVASAENGASPGFVNKMQPQQQQPIRQQFSLSQPQFPQQQQQPILRSVVHHTPQPQQQQQQHNFNVPNQLIANRMIGQQQRPNLQQLRGQLTPTQMQQLMQQRLQQQQRPLLNVQQQQQLLQQRQLQLQGQTQPNPQLLAQQQQQQQQVNKGQLVQPQQQQQQYQQQQPLPPLQQSNQLMQPQNNQHLLQQQQQLLQQQQQQQQNQMLQQKMFPPPPPPPPLQQQQLLANQQPNLALQQQQQFVGATPKQQQFQQQQQMLQQPQQFPQQQQRPILQQTAAQQQLWQQQQPLNQNSNANTNPRPPLAIIHQQQQGQRIQWSPNQQQQQQPQPQRQYIQLDAQTHNQLQKMPPEQQALFVARLQKQKQLQQQQQQQQRPGGHILIRGSVPPGLSPQQQMQWLQQQARQQGVILPPNIQQQALATASPVQQQQPQQPGLSPIQQNVVSGTQPNPPQQPQQFVGAAGGDTHQQQQQQLQMRQFRLQQLQQAQKQQLAAAAVQSQSNLQHHQVNPERGLVDPQQQQQQQLVNTKAKTALANMLSNRLQGGTAVNMVPVPETGAPPPLQQVSAPQTASILEPQSAAGTLRLMTAQHNAALNNTRTPQDLIALQQQQQQQQLRTINGPNGEIIRAPPPPPQQTTNQQPAQQERLGFASRAPPAVLPVQHRPGPFYGHNPNLKLPPDLFLLGCIFVVVEVERALDESLPGWTEHIEKHGGEVEKQYCNRVTHVLCETQRHGVVMQALRDCKRCVTVFWLSDIMKRKHVLPPWTALHLPTAYMDTTPAAKHLIALTGFSGLERRRVKHMIHNSGAKFTKYFSKHNTILVAARSEGFKFQHAKKWAIPVVNVQWLTDVLLGNFTALNQLEHVSYQQFPAQNEFSFDPKFVPNLMHAWKMPINISQESYERVKRSASPVLMPKQAKKPKLERNTDENDNVNESAESVTSNYRILFSHSSDLEGLQKIVTQLGGILAKSPRDCTHLVMKGLARTNKLLLCLCRGNVQILPEQWLRDSHSAGRFLEDTSNYALETKEFNRVYKCNFVETLQTNNRHRLMAGKTFWITPSVYPSKNFLAELIESCGGVVERIRWSAQQIEQTNVSAPYSYIVITHDNDIHLVADLLRNPNKDKVKIVCNAELIFSAILRQTFQVEPYAVQIV